MAINPESTWLSLERSVFVFIQSVLDTGELAGKISYDDSEFDTSGLDRWVTVNVLDLGIGVTSDIQLQFTVAQRKEQDRFSARMKQTVDLIKTAMNINAIQIKNYGSALEGGSGEPIYLDGELLEAAVRHTGPDGRLPDTIPGIRSYVMTYTLHLWRSDVVE